MRKKGTRSTKGNNVDTVVNGFFKLIGGLFKLLFKAIIMLGLWVPILYALFGVILHYTLGFEPFDFSTFSTFYIVGGIVCIVIVVIISAYNVLINPLKRAFGKKKSPAERAQERTELQPPLTEEKKKRSLFGRKKTAPVRNVYQREPEGNDYSDAQSLDWIPKQDPTAAINADQTGERPDVYFSTLKPDILVHEYHDRFELFRVEGNKLVSIGTEFK